MRFGLDLEVRGPQFGPHEIYIGDVHVATRRYDGSTPEDIAREFIGHLGAVVANRDLWETADSPIAYDEPLTEATDWGWHVADPALRSGL